MDDSIVKRTFEIKETQKLQRGKSDWSSLNHTFGDLIRNDVERIQKLCLEAATRGQSFITLSQPIDGLVQRYLLERAHLGLFCLATRLDEGAKVAICSYVYDFQVVL